MSTFTMERCSSLPQNKLFELSTDVENFHNIMPENFKSLEVIKENEYGKLVIEKINFLGIPLKIKTKHIIVNPNVHEIHILSGPTKGTVFTETYVQSGNGTIVSIEVKLILSGFYRLFGFLEGFLKNKMSATMDKFIVAVEKYDSSLTAYQN
ncbi:MAG: hypothetical protein HKP31_06175 [Nitrosopumilus sp.]|nr:hypothetical protein [Nitrosopumilus sp.]